MDSVTFNYLNEKNANQRQSRHDQKSRKHRIYYERRSLSVGARPRGRNVLITRQPLAPQRRLSVAPNKIKRVKFSTKQQWTLICLSIVSFTSMLSMSIIAPFFPLEASMKGMRESVYGFVFSVYALVIMVLSPFSGMIIPHIGPKFMLISGVFVAGSSNILFGLLDLIDDLQTFTIYCFVVRIFEAVGAAAFSTASYTIIMQLFPDNVGTAFGIVETCVGLGMSLGPAIGGGLYELGGYGLPFYILGTIMLINLPLCWYIIKPIKVTKTSKNSFKSYFKLLTIYRIFIVGIIVIIISQTVTFLDPTVEPHFRSMDLSPSFVSVVFLLESGAYTLCSPLVGWLSSFTENKFPMMALGLLISGVGLLLLGPSFVLPIDPSLSVSIVAMVIIGVGYAIAFIPTFESILDIAIDNGFEDNINTYGLVSGLWSSMFSLGEVTGPTLGGWLDENLDYSYTVTIMAAFCIIGVVIASTACCFPTSNDDDSDSDYSSSYTSSTRESDDEKKIRENEYDSLIENSDLHKYGSQNKVNEFYSASV